jgi:hypothetical protein
MTLKLTIPADRLAALELSVKEQMSAGRWQVALEEIRSTAALFGMGSDDLARAVIAKGFELGHISPLPEMGEAQ